MLGSRDLNNGDVRYSSYAIIQVHSGAFQLVVSAYGCGIDSVKFNG